MTTACIWLRGLGVEPSVIAAYETGQRTGACDRRKVNYAIDVYAPLAYKGSMSNAPHTIAELPQFIRDCADAGVTEDEKVAIIDGVAADPMQGDEVQGSGGVRKVRFAGRGKGKSGGYRVITAYFGPHAPTYLLALLSKGDRANFSRAEVAAFKALTTAIDRYWKGR